MRSINVSVSLMPLMVSVQGKNEAVQKATITLHKPKLFRFDGFLSAMDKTSPLEVGDRTKCNEVQGDDREKLTSTQAVVRHA